MVAPSQGLRWLLIFVHGNSERRISYSGLGSAQLLARVTDAQDDDRVAVGGGRLRNDAGVHGNVALQTYGDVNYVMDKLGGFGDERSSRSAARIVTEADGSGMVIGVTSRRGGVVADGMGRAHHSRALTWLEFAEQAEGHAACHHHHQKPFAEHDSTHDGVRNVWDTGKLPAGCGAAG